MKPNKKVIRLTESQLYDIISESVKQALNELDPRTYASAADKAQSTFNYDRSDKFRKAAERAWNKRFEKDEYDSNSGTYHVRNMSNNYNVIDHYQKHPDIEDIYSGHLTSTEYNPYDDTEKITDVDFKDGMEFNRIKGEKMPRKQNLSHGKSIARQMAKGDGKYIKGKGWQ